MSAKQALRFGDPDFPQFVGQRTGSVVKQSEQCPPGQVAAASHRVRVEGGVTKNSAQVVQHTFPIEVRRRGLRACDDGHR